MSVISTKLINFLLCMQVCFGPIVWALFVRRILPGVFYTLHARARARNVQLLPKPSSSGWFAPKLIHLSLPNSNFQPVLRTDSLICRSYYSLVEFLPYPIARTCGWNNQFSRKAKFTQIMFDSFVTAWAQAICLIESYPDFSTHLSTCLEVASVLFTMSGTQGFEVNGWIHNSIPSVTFVLKNSGVRSICFNWFIQASPGDFQLLCLQGKLQQDSLVSSSRKGSKLTRYFSGITSLLFPCSIYETEGLVKRLGLLGSICKATTLYQVMTRG